MFDAGWRSEALHAPARDSDLARSQGAADVGFAIRDGKTRLAHLFQSSPCRVAFPHQPPGELPLAVLLTTTGGLTGGDRIRLSLGAGDGAAAIVTTQAAEKIYRSLGDDTAIDVRVDVGAGAWLEWLPQETILFDGARMRRRTAVHVAPDARLLAGEILVFGRTAHGERFERGLAHDGWRIHADGRLVWADALHLDRDIPMLLDRAAGFAGARAVATMLYHAPDAPAAARPRARAGRRGVRARRGQLHRRPSRLPLYRRRCFQVRQAFAGCWRQFRAAVAGLAPRLPRLWDV